MNHLSIRGGPKLEFILKPYQQDFEKRVIDVYFKSADKKERLPHIYDDMFLYLLLERPEQFVSAYLGCKHNDPFYFSKITGEMSEREHFLFVKETMDRYNSNIESEFDDLLYYDIKTVLDFNHISFNDIQDIGNWKNTSFYKNLPNVQVW